MQIVLLTENKQYVNDFRVITHAMKKIKQRSQNDRHGRGLSTELWVERKSHSEEDICQNDKDPALQRSRETALQSDEGKEQVRLETQVEPDSREGLLAMAKAGLLIMGSYWNILRRLAWT